MDRDEIFKNLSYLNGYRDAIKGGRRRNAPLLFDAEYKQGFEDGISDSSKLDDDDYITLLCYLGTQLQDEYKRVIELDKQEKANG